MNKLLTALLTGVGTFCLLAILALPAAAQDPGDNEQPPAGEPDAQPDSGNGDATPGAGDGETPPEDITEQNRQLREQVIALRKQLAEAQDVKKPAPPPERGARLSAKITVSGLFSIGNTDSIAFDGAFGLSLEDPYLYEFSTSLTYQLIETDNEIKQDRLTHVLGFDYLPNDRFSPFAFVKQGYDDKRRISYEFESGIGLKWTPFRDPWDPLEYNKDPRHKYSISLALLIDHEQFQPTAHTDHRTFVRFSLWLKGSQRLADGLFISDWFEFYPAVEDLTNWTMKNTLSIEIEFEGKHSMGLSWSYAEDSTPAAGVKRTDQQFKISLHLKLK